MTIPFPQRKNPGLGHPISDDVRAMRAELARAQHAARRGYEIRPGHNAAFKKSFARLRKHGLSYEEACAMLRPDFAAP